MAETGRTGTVTFYVVRHGETEANRGGVFQGHMDVPLSDRGRKQAEAVAGALSEVRLDVVYSSDLSRAAETAKAIMAHQTCALVLDRRLREIHGGRCQGHVREETEAMFPEFMRAFERDPVNTRRPGGESFADLSERVQRSLDDISEWNAGRPGGATVAVIGHGGVIRAILAIAGADASLMDRPVPNCSLSMLERLGDAWTVVKVGVTAHLDDLEED